MMRDIRYILKRILIGVGVVLVLSFLRGNLLISAKALEPIYQGVHYYSNYDLVYNNNFPNSTSKIVDFNFHNNLNLPNDNNTTYLINIPCSFSITYGSLQWYVGSDSSYATIKDLSFQYYIVGNHGQRWIPGTFTNGMLQFYVPGGTQLHNITIYFTTPGGLNQTHNAYYSISLNSGITYYKLGSNQDIINNQNQNTQAIIDSQENINNTINDSNVSSATGDASGFFGNFQSNSHGLSGIITAPLRLLNTFTTATCSPLEFDLPIVHNHVSLPCMRGIYEQHFGVFFSLWQLITTGLISYNICINLYGKVRNLQNPNNDRIEVLNL